MTNKDKKDKKKRAAPNFSITAETSFYYPPNFASQHGIVLGHLRLSVKFGFLFKIIFLHLIPLVTKLHKFRSLLKRSSNYIYPAGLTRTDL